MKKFLSLVLALSMMLALVACGGNNSTNNGGNASAGDNGNTEQSGDKTPTNENAIEDLVVWQLSSQEFETFLIHNSESSTEGPISANCYTPLLESNNKGQLQPAAATEWGSEDGGLTWTFKLRDDVVWVDYNGNEKGQCTAQDWLTGMEWVLNFHKNGAKNTSMPTALIQGAQEYYDYTKELDEAEAMALTADGKFAELVGIEAPDDYTLVYHCTKNAPYFDTLATCVCLYPLPQGMIDELGVENVESLTYTELWYSGPYTITSYIQGNEKVFTKNESYWDKDCTLFNTVTEMMIDDGLTDDLLYETGEVDQCTLNEATLKRIYEEGESNEYYDQLVEGRYKKYSYQMHWNYYKMNEDGTVDTNFNTAIANEAFRQSLVYGLDLTNYWSRTNNLNPMSCENLAYTMRGLCYFSDGTDYVKRVLDGLGYDYNYGDKPQRLDTAKATEYKEQAMKELEGKVEFPVEFDYYIQAGSQTALDSAIVVKEIFEALGTDYITLNICTYVSSASKEVYTPGLHSFCINGWGADYGDVENFIGQEIYGYDSAYYSNRYSRINSVDPAAEPELIATYEEFTELALAAADICDDMDARYEAYAQAEIYMLEHALVTPCSYSITWQLTKINIYSRTFCMYGAQNDSWKNVETNANGYTTAEYEAIKAEFNA